MLRLCYYLRCRGSFVYFSRPEVVVKLIETQDTMEISRCIRCRFMVSYECYVNELSVDNSRVCCVGRNFFSFSVCESVLRINYVRQNGSHARLFSLDTIELECDFFFWSFRNCALLKWLHHRNAACNWITAEQLVALILAGNKSYVLAVGSIE